MDYPPFPGFRPEAFEFLRQLEKNNRRDWFKPRKATFDDEVKWPLACLVSDVAREAGYQQLPLKGDPKKSLFRLYRDTRFSKNKNPYKTHLGAVLSRDGARKTSGGLYIHIQPGESFVAAGFWQPEPPFLRAWRTRIAEGPEGFLSLSEQLERAYLQLDARERLKRMPRGFENHVDSSVASYLKWKSFIVSRSFPDSGLQDSAFTQSVVSLIHDVLPLLQYGWELEDSLTDEN